MKPLPGPYETMMRVLTEWGQTQPDVSAAMVVGSQARRSQAADAWSDLDVVMFVTIPEVYLLERDWVKTFGKPVLSFIEATAVSEQQELRVLYDNGKDVDFSILPTAMLEQLASSGIPLEAQTVIARGVSILFDKTGHLHTTLSVSELRLARPDKPSQAAFGELVSDYYYHALWTAKKLRRGELRTAKSCHDGYMKALLLQAIKWHTQVVGGSQLYVWHSGRFLERWADPRIVTELETAFSHYNEPDIWRGLVQAAQLFGWVTKEVATRLELAYPAEAAEYVVLQVQRLRDELA